ncbi:MAG: hypothetical protein ACRD12_06435 [Acidimicrobiales bacterium]
MPTVIGPIPSIRSRDAADSRSGAGAVMGGALVATGGSVVEGVEVVGVVVVEVVGEVVGEDTAAPATGGLSVPPQPAVTVPATARAMAVVRIRFMRPIVRPGHHDAIAVR